MEKEIIIKIGGTYDLRERPQQVLLMPKKGPPIILSHDKDITHALKQAVAYIEHKLINVKNEYAKELK